MTVNRELRKRPIKFIKDDEIKADSLEKVLSHFDSRIIELDKRRIAQQTAIEEGASDSETITNLLSGINNLLAALNASSLTED